MAIYYTDGSCSPNPGAGGFAVIKDLEPVATGFDKASTNIRMEGMALIQAFKHASSGDTIYSDSQFWISVVKDWAPNWESRGWKKPGGEIKNIDIVKELYELYQQSAVDLLWVRGHEGDMGNEMADQWANKAREQKLSFIK